ncbi:MAG TPA: alpha-amylase family glycosyl hydrolase, partial [Mycobacteriales bacterium]|nr:alpha-amylase family glycosyl hydrolase [Mycobacteriales bacterium]
MSTPSSTYRLQLTPSFTLFDAAKLVPYLADLGVSHVYCSPWLRSAPGSQHGYDVVDHTQVDQELGGASGVVALHQACRSAGLGIVLDLVPNHMHVGDPQENAVWWDVLEHGEQSQFASWFDIDWTAGPVRVPVVGDGGEQPPAGSYPDSAAHELVLWREGPSYRRFFDVDTLAGLRVEDPEVFTATHAVIADQVASGVLDGLRIDHPDGLADPEGYLEQLRTIAPDIWVVTEKILAEHEELPTSWPCDGTTGYDAASAVTQLMCDPAGEGELTRLAAELGGDTLTWHEHADAGQRLVVEALFRPELDRLTTLAAAALPAEQSGSVRLALAELLIQLPVYRAYVRPGKDPTAAAARYLDEAAVAARLAAPAVADTIDALLPVLLGASGDHAELVVRFQQVSGPVMAKGVEDTACYRALRLLALNEVGGDPGAFGTS